MPRLNIYVSDVLARELRSLSHDLNVSKVCSRALWEELEWVQKSHPNRLFLKQVLERPSTVNEGIAFGYKLRSVITGNDSRERPDARPTVAYWAAEFLRRTLMGEMQLAIGGGCQMWQVVQGLRRGGTRLRVWALGCGQVDARVPHLHANALATMLSLIYAPRCTVSLVGTAGLSENWSLDAPVTEDLSRIIIGSCATYNPLSAYAQLLDEETRGMLYVENAVSEFLGVFFRSDGTTIEPYVPRSPQVSHIAAADLRAHAQRPDTIVALAAGGKEKLKAIVQVLEAELCNTLITDSLTANRLLNRYYAAHPL